MLDEALHVWEKEEPETDAIECLLDPLNSRLKVAVINRQKRCACVTPVRLINDSLREDYYHALKTGLSLHDDLEAIYQQATDFDSLNQFVTGFITEHISSQSATEDNRQPMAFIVFLGPQRLMVRLTLFQN